MAPLSESRTVMKQAARRAARVAATPLRSYVNSTIARIEANWTSRMDRLEHRLLGDLEANIELTASHARTLTQLRERLDELPQKVTEAALKATEAALTGLIGRTPAEIDPPTADFANWINSHKGFAAQAHHWLNHGVAIEHRIGGIGVAGVNERTIEIPFVLQALGGVAVPARIFDLGSLESLVPLSLASLGHRVTALDLHPYPFTHPNIEVAVSPIQDWPDPAQPFDAVISLSALEHMGLEAYGQETRASDLDRRTMARFHNWLRPGGLLVFTAPFGRWHVDGFQRVYDEEHLDALLRGFRITHRRFAVRGEDGYWTSTSTPPVDAASDGGAGGAVLLTATPEK